jgi:hypothetical protein
MEVEVSEQFPENSASHENNYQRAYTLFAQQFGEKDTRSLLTAFVEAMELLLIEVDAHVAQRDAVLLKRLTHRVIGMCPVYLATETAALGEMIEAELMLGDWSKIEDLRRQLRTSFQKYLGKQI